MALNTKTDIRGQTMVEIANQSFDTSYQVAMVEPVTVNAVTGTLERPTAIQGNSSLVLSYDGSGNLTTIEKTVGATTYTKILSYTGSDLTGISEWS
jgi:hypothetical protein